MLIFLYHILLVLLILHKYIHLPPAILLGLLDGASDDFWQFGKSHWTYLCIRHLRILWNFSPFWHSDRKFGSFFYHHNFSLQTISSLWSDHQASKRLGTNQILERMAGNLADFFSPKAGGWCGLCSSRQYGQDLGSWGQKTFHGQKRWW